MLPSAQVIAVTATFQRAPELARLFASLARSTHPIFALVVVDNANDAATQALAANAPFPVVCEVPGTNLGCGGGLALGEKLALERFPALTHIWILDDDCEVAPDALEVLLPTMAKAGADLAHPLTEDGAGYLSWFPGLTDAVKFRAVRQHQTPAEFMARCGPEPIPFSWSQGIALLVSRRALEELGPHRTDYWVRGEDLEFSLRITARYLGLYVPLARVRHLPPASSNEPAAEWPKHLALLQNLAYTSLRLPHGRRIIRTIPGNLWRFVQTWRSRPRSFLAALGALWRGAIQARPAGRNEERKWLPRSPA